MTSLRPRYVAVDGTRVHLRAGGDGPVVLVVPGTTGVDEAVLDLCEDLVAAGRTVVVPDLPGTGGSDPRSTALDALGEWVGQVATAVATGRPDVVLAGEAGAAAADVPRALVGRVVVCAAGWPDPGHRDAWLTEIARLGEALVPRVDGGHLASAWWAVRRRWLFAPWFVGDRAARRSVDLPAPTAIEGVVLHLLDGFDSLLRLEQAAARAEPPEVHERRAVLDLLADPPASTPAEPTPAPVAGTGCPRCYVDVDGADVHVRTVGRGAGRPLLVVHPSPGSAVVMERMASAIEGRVVVLTDTPGNGRSTPGPLGADLEWVAHRLLDALERLGIDELDVLGSHTGSLIGVEMALAAPHRVRRLVCDGLPLFGPEVDDRFVEAYLPELEADAHGAHLQALWHMFHDMLLFFPWYEHRGAAARAVRAATATELAATFSDVLLSGRAWQGPYRAALRHPTRSRLEALRVPTLAAAGPNDPLRAHLPELAASFPNVTTIETAGTGRPENLRSTVEAYRRFLDAPEALAR